MSTQDYFKSNDKEDISNIPISFISNSRLLCEGLSLLLAEEIQFTLIATYTSVAPRTENLKNPDQHIVLLDTAIGCDYAVDWTYYWCKRTPPARVLMLEMLPDPDTILACIEAGACGYTLHGASPADVAKMIHLVQQGHAICSPKITAHLFRRLAELKELVLHAGTACTPLTEREMEVMRYVTDGLSNQEIADKLVITVRTVKFHIHNVLEKLNLNNRKEAAAFVLAEGWV